MKFVELLNQQPPQSTRYHPQSTETIGNHPETTRNYLLHRNPPPHPHAKSQQTLPCFSAVDFEHDFIIRKVELQKQPSEVFCEKDILKNFAKLTGKHLRWNLFFNPFTPAHPQDMRLDLKRFN